MQAFRDAEVADGLFGVGDEPGADPFVDFFLVDFFFLFGNLLLGIAKIHRGFLNQGPAFGGDAVFTEEFASEDVPIFIRIINREIPIDREDDLKAAAIDDEGVIRTTAMDDEKILDANAFDDFPD